MIIVIFILIAALAGVFIWAIPSNRKKDALIQQLQTEKLKLERNNASLEEQLRIFATMEDRFLKEFKSISNEALNMQREEMTKAQTANLNNTISPFAVQLGNLKKELGEKLTEVNHITIDSKAQLQQQLETLGKTSASLQQEAVELTEALRGNKKLQGNWAEIQLEHMFELVEWQDGVQYVKQEHHLTEEHGRQYPDYVVNLTEERRIILDAKMTLNSYTDYIATTDEVEKKEYMAKFITATKKHIDELADKDYQKLVTGHLDFVFMFIPLEHAYLEALKADKTLFDYASRQKVAIVTPSILFPMLRTIDSVWKIEKQNKNVKSIIDWATKMYDKFGLALEAFGEVKKSLTRADKAYETAYSRLAGGNGNVLSFLNKIRDEGGLQTKKTIAIEDGGDIDGEEEKKDDDRLI
jgi:DNA recombination protein RmuC